MNYMFLNFGSFRYLKLERKILHSINVPVLKVVYAEIYPDDYWAFKQASEGDFRGLRQHCLHQPAPGDPYRGHLRGGW